MGHNSNLNGSVREVSQDRPEATGETGEKTKHFRIGETELNPRYRE